MTGLHDPFDQSARPGPTPGRRLLVSCHTASLLPSIGLGGHGHYAPSAWGVRCKSDSEVGPLSNNNFETADSSNVISPSASMGEITTLEAGAASRPDWGNLAVLHRNTLQPRSSFFLYDDESNALSRDTAKAKALSLAGKWKFHISNSPYEAPSGFEAPSFDSSTWGNIRVPGEKTCSTRCPHPMADHLDRHVAAPKLWPRSSLY